jgi:HSP90 family molecular chaperone
LTYDLAIPRPEALIESLRSVGYSLAAALADIIDNSIAASANNVWIDFHWNGGSSNISILDDGHGMGESSLVEAMRPGSSSPLDTRASSDLGRFGLGLKTASFSQARELHVWSKEAEATEHGRCWDLEYVSTINPEP